ncbi:MAG: class II fructose-bisphosphate aldolase [Treponema sp.]|nr:class II fructose-bisphosphate aldolase [Treponema sp.]
MWYQELKRQLYHATGLPLVLHGGSGVNLDYIRKGIKAGIAKINVGTEIRQTYEKAIEVKNDIGYAQEAVYTKVREIIINMEISNNHSMLFGV